MAFTCLIALGSGIIQTRAFDLSFRMNGIEQGQVTEPDFYSNLQNALMQLLGLYTAILPCLKHQSVRRRYPWWVWIFAAGSFVLNVSAVGIYFWFAALAPLVAFVGCCMQAFMVLQFDPTSFLSFTTWYEKKHNAKLDADPAELTKLMAAFKTIQDALSL